MFGIAVLPYGFLTTIKGGGMNASPDFYIELANRLWIAFETWPHGVINRTARADLRLASEAIRQCAMERLKREEPKAVNCQDGR
jgi:hypothetical protein